MTIRKQPGAWRGVHQRLKAVRQQMRHALGAAIFDVVMDRVGVAARGLERGEDRRGLGAARQHEALAEHEILEPALLGHHAVRGGIELGHGVFLGVSLAVLRQLVQFRPGACPRGTRL